ncbi:MAG: tetratricopeptide repeat protein [Geobacter sp.]|nr:MAG: tetratricopeptide repeat protein [Geobacter sp.]
MTEATIGTRRPSRRLWLPFLVLAAATLLVYSVSFFNGFVLDDEMIIVNNPQTLSLRNVPDVLFAPDLVKPYYRPLNRATYLFDYQIAGMDPAWYHGVNIVIHFGNALLLYLICRRLLSDRWAALAVGLLFAVHPANSEAVNWVSARNTLMALFFSLASLLAYLESRMKGKVLLVASPLLYFCGLLSKETGLMMSAVFFVLTFFPLQEGEARLSWKDRIILLSPYFVLTLVYFCMRFYSLQGVVGTPVPASGLLERVAQNYHIIPQYLALLLYPADLTLFHKVPNGGLFSPPWHLAAMLFLTWLVWLALRSRNRVALFSLVWFAINYAPISNVVPIPSDQITERYLYMPAVGFFFGLGAVLSWILTLATPRFAKAAVVVILVAASAVTMHRNLDWRNALSLFTSGVRNDPESPGAHYNLGTAYMENGDFAAARREWERTLALDARHGEAMMQMGTLAATSGDLRTAEAYYRAALEAPPGQTDPGKSMAHLNLGKICEKRGDLKQALQHYRLFMKTVPVTYMEYKGDTRRRIKLLEQKLIAEGATSHRPPGPAVGLADI